MEGKVQTVFLTDRKIFFVSEKGGGEGGGRGRRIARCAKKKAAINVVKKKKGRGMVWEKANGWKRSFFCGMGRTEIESEASMTG